MTFASYIRRERIVTHALIFGGEIFACPAADWQATGREKLFTNYNALSFPWVAIFEVTLKPLSQSPSSRFSRAPSELFSREHCFLEFCGK